MKRLGYTVSNFFYKHRTGSTYYFPVPTIRLILAKQLTEHCYEWFYWVTLLLLFGLGLTQILVIHSDIIARREDLPWDPCLNLCLLTPTHSVPLVTPLPNLVIPNLLPSAASGGIPISLFGGDKLNPASHIYYLLLEIASQRCQGMGAFIEKRSFKGHCRRV